MGKINNVINKVKDFWLKPNEEDEYEQDKANKIKKACEELHMRPESIELLLESCNGLQWTGYSEKEELETRKNPNKGKNLVRPNSETHEKYEKQQERSQEDSNNSER